MSSEPPKSPEVPEKSAEMKVGTPEVSGARKKDPPVLTELKKEVEKAKAAPTGCSECSKKPCSCSDETKAKRIRRIIRPNLKEGLFRSFDDDITAQVDPKFKTKDKYGIYEGTLTEAQAREALEKFLKKNHPELHSWLLEKSKAGELCCGFEDDITRRGRNYACDILANSICGACYGDR